MIFHHTTIYMYMDEMETNISNGYKKPNTPVTIADFYDAKN